jgi:hypothetical protein
MAKKKSTSTKTKATPSTRSDTRQLAFDFYAAYPIALAKAETSKAEVLPPLSQADLIERSPLTEGDRERDFLLHQSDKYEERALRMQKTFFLTASAAVLIKGGVPIAKVLLDKGGYPAIDNLQLLAGILGGATLIFASVLLRYTLTLRHYTQQLQLPLVRRSLAGIIARSMFAIEAAVLISTFAVVMYLTLGDMIYLLTYVVDHLRYTLEGWEPVLGR